MKTVVFILLALPSLAQQVSPEDLRIVLNDSTHNAILRQFINENKPSGISPDKTVLTIHSTYCEEGNFFSHEWILRATGRYDNSKGAELPTCIAEVDGFLVLIWFNRYTDHFISYSEAYKKYIAQIYAKLKSATPIIRTQKNLKQDGTAETVTYEEPLPAEKFSHWLITFTHNGKASIKKDL